MIRRCLHYFVVALLFAALCPGLRAHKKTPVQKHADSLEHYLQQVSQAVAAQKPANPGSLFIAGGLLGDPYTDYRARQVGDTISIQISESTTIAQSGSVATQRDFSHSSGVTGVGGQTPGFLNPLLAANSSTKLSGTGATASKNQLSTVLSGQVVAVLPSGSLVIESRRQLFANQQSEVVILRGTVRPADISAGNLIYSFQLTNLELEVQGKGVISDSVRQPNIVMRMLLKLISF